MDAAVAKYFTMDVARPSDEGFPVPSRARVDIKAQAFQMVNGKNLGPARVDLYRCKECAALTDTPVQHAQWHEQLLQDLSNAWLGR